MTEIEVISQYCTYDKNTNNCGFFLHVPVLVTVSILYLEFNFLFQKIKS